MTGFVILVLLVAGGGAGLRLYLGRAAENQLWPDERVAIAELRSPLPGNAALACPPGYCTVSEAIDSPVFPMPVERLAGLWDELITGAPRVIRIIEEHGHNRTVYIQRSALIGFPDLITVEFVAVAPDRSSVAIYSRARYGTVDFGVNRKRVEAWLARLRQRAAAT